MGRGGPDSGQEARPRAEAEEQMEDRHLLKLSRIEELSFGGRLNGVAVDAIRKSMGPGWRN